MRQVSGRLEPRANNVKTARRFVAGRLEELAWPGDIEVIALLVSELITNAIVHAAPHDSKEQIALTISISKGLVRVEVGDANPSPPTRIVDAALDAPSGRGLALVDALSTTWGVTPTTSGKFVWFEVRA